MDKRLFLFLSVSLTIMLGFQMLSSVLFPQPEKPVVQQDDDAAKDRDDPRDEPGDEPQGTDEVGDGEPSDGERAPSHAGNSDEPEDAREKAPADAPPAVALQRVTLGSLDPSSPVRMLVTLTNRGAAVERIELNNPRYGDVEDRSGYLGSLLCSDAKEGGCLVGIVGPGTPAALAGLQPGDRITDLDGSPIETAQGLVDRLLKTKARDVVEISVVRDGKPVGPLRATLIRRPLELIRPEFQTKPVRIDQPGQHDQFSLLCTLAQVGDDKLIGKNQELEGVHLRDDNWVITKQTAWVVEFTRKVAKYNLTFVKRYTLAEVAADALENDDYRAYHLEVDLEIHNDRAEETQIAYRLDGPTGLPTEGWWYSNKIGRSWGGRRLRDVAMHTEIDGAVLYDTSGIVSRHEEGEQKPVPLRKSGSVNNPLGYLGIDTQYFSAILLPSNRTESEQRYASIETLVVGDIPADPKRQVLTNVTSRMTSEPKKLEAGAALTHSFVFFVGPKRATLLSEYSPEAYPQLISINELIYYGWPIWAFFATRLAGLLHILYAIFQNYGLAIILLTVMVRLCMFPLSRKQALNAQKMQELQPQMKRITEKYKNDMEKRSKALQEIYKKHGYNPMAGCLPLFIQMPIFIGLYRSLMADIELRQAPLISSSFPWCDNLAAPDMLWKWEGMLPFLVSETGFLGPYLNVLPLITCGLFILQQKMFMPPAADEQAAMQQKVMQYMMIFMGFLFFRVPSGLCLYFISSSLWGLAERKFLPKKTDPGTTPDASKERSQPEQKKSRPANGTSSGRSKKKKKGRR